MADALLWPPETPLSVNHHVCDFHRVESLPDSSWWLSTKDFVDFVCPFSVSNNEKEKHPVLIQTYTELIYAFHCFTD